MIDEDSKAGCGDDEYLRPEGVALGVVSGAEFPEDEGERGVSTKDEHDLHHSVVVRDEVGEEIEVASCEYNGVQHLALAANP